MKKLTLLIVALVLSLATYSQTARTYNGYYRFSANSLLTADSANYLTQNLWWYGPNGYRFSQNGVKYSLQSFFATFGPFWKTNGNTTLTTNVTISGGKVTFTPTSTRAGINIGAVAGTVSSPVNGDLWYDNTGNRIFAGMSGVIQEIIAGAVDPTEVVYGQSTGKVITDNEFTYNGTTNQLSVPTISLSSITGPVAISFNQRAVFTPSATVEGITVGTLAGDPSSPNNGGIWYNSTAGGSGSLMARIAGQNASISWHLGQPSSGLVPFYNGTNGRLVSDPDFTFNTTTNTLHPTNISLPVGGTLTMNAFSANRILYTNTGGVITTSPLFRFNQTGTGILEVAKMQLEDALLQDDALTQVLVREPVNGDIKYRDASTFGAGAFLKLNGTSTATGTMVLDLENNPFSINADDGFTGGRRVTYNSDEFSINEDEYYLQFTSTSATPANRALFTDLRSTKKGIEYGGPGYVTQDHSLADKEYVDNAVATGATGENGLNGSGTIKLGGDLTEVTEINTSILDEYGISIEENGSGVDVFSANRVGTNSETGVELKSTDGNTVYLNNDGFTVDADNVIIQSKSGGPVLLQSPVGGTGISLQALGGDISLSGNGAATLGVPGNVLLQSSGGVMDLDGSTRVQLISGGSVRLNIQSDGAWSLGATSGNEGTTGQVIQSNGASAAPTWGPVLTSGRYNPSFTIVGGSLTSTPTEWHYSRNGSEVTIAGWAQVDPDATGNIAISFTLPSGMTSNFNDTLDLIGTANISNADFTNPGEVYSDGVNDRGVIAWWCGADVITSVRITAVYSIQ